MFSKSELCEAASLEYGMKNRSEKGINMGTLTSIAFFFFFF